MNAQNLCKRVLKISWDHWVSLFLTPHPKGNAGWFLRVAADRVAAPARYAEGWGSYLNLSAYQLGTKMQQALLQ